MEGYTAYINSKENKEGKRIFVVSDSKLENSLYSIEGFRPNLSAIIYIPGIPWTKKGFYKLVKNTFEKSILLDCDLESFCKKYAFKFKKLN